MAGQAIETFIAVDPGLDYVAASLWNVTDWRGDSRLEVCGRRFLGVRTCRTAADEELPVRLNQLRDWIGGLVWLEGENAAWCSPTVVAIELPPIASAYQRNRGAQRTRTDPTIAKRAPFYMALGALAVSCLPARVVLVPPPAGVKKARYPGELDRRAIVQHAVPGALRHGQANQDVVDAIALGLDCLTRWPLSV